MDKLSSITAVSVIYVLGVLDKLSFITAVSVIYVLGVLTGVFALYGPDPDMPFGTCEEITAKQLAFEACLANQPNCVVSPGTRTVIEAYRDYYERQQWLTEKCDE